jgi:hypothetical protein
MDSTIKRQTNIIYMKQKKYTVNERLALVEKVTYKLALEVQAIIKAINLTREEDKKETE